MKYTGAHENCFAAHGEVDLAAQDGANKLARDLPHRPYAV
jgi:hypothetical protein